MRHAPRTPVRVWDIVIRLFHWLLVAAFVVSYLSAEEWEEVHVISGYTIASLLGIRLIWGVIGTRHARFSDFVKPPAQVLAYLRDIRAGHPKRYLGHNPAGGAMVIALLLSLITTCFLGTTLLAIHEGEGPFVGTVLATLPEDPIEELHEFFANFTLALIVLHIIGVIVASKQHGENLPRAMLTGKKMSD